MSETIKNLNIIMCIFMLSFPAYAGWKPAEKLIIAIVGNWDQIFIKTNDKSEMVKTHSKIVIKRTENENVELISTNLDSKTVSIEKFSLLQNANSYKLIIDKTVFSGINKANSYEFSATYGGFLHKIKFTIMSNYVIYYREKWKNKEIVGIEYYCNSNTRSKI